ncbi:hypothetical protein C8F04DRAFT_1315960 [Mycena alexandri]|uniref:Uncharacterized protein n=1 Tax=Mycena alexandri TaxID=1745969 RepID=A0AAD6T5J8_9AGAR|nr:hypothetical protein C8F04DRAFT_1315960 [Mycena alexandri]
MGCCALLLVPKLEQRIEPDLLHEILMVEDCENQQPSHSLFYEGVMHNSFCARNILVQPGPLTHPPHRRSLANTPSFRLIDFGRAQRQEDLLSKVGGPIEGSYTRTSKAYREEAATEAKAARKRIRAAWLEWFSKEREIAREAVFARLCEFINDFDSWGWGRLGRADRIFAREWPGVAGPFEGLSWHQKG